MLSSGSVSPHSAGESIIGTLAALLQGVLGASTDTPQNLNLPAGGTGARRQVAKISHHPIKGVVASETNALQQRAELVEETLDLVGGGGQLGGGGGVSSSATTASC